MTDDLYRTTFRDRRVLITGGIGFIGSNLATELVDLGAEVLLVDSLIPEYGGNLFNVDHIRDRVTVNIADIRDVHGMRYLVQGQDFIFNLAGQTSHMDSMADPMTDLEINCRAQLSLLEACREANPDAAIVFASTRQFYGTPQYLPVNETHPTRATDVNGINKLAGESYHRLYHDVYGIRTSCLRLTNTFGPRMRVRDARQTFLGVWIRLALEGRPFEVWGGDQLRDFTYVDDAVDALLRAGGDTAAAGEIYNVGGPPPVSLLELAEMLVDLQPGSEFVLREFPADRRKIDIGSYYADDAKLRDELGWEPRASLRAGLEQTLHYYREHLQHYV